MSLHTHTCVKCTKTYQDEDVEAYYCAECLAEHKEMAAALDANRAKSEKAQSRSELAMFESDPRTIIRNGGNVIFIRESQL